MADWTPTAEGADFELPCILEPLAAVQGRPARLTGLTADKARPNGDGPGDHARAWRRSSPAASRARPHGADIRSASRSTRSPPHAIGDATRLRLAGARLRARAAGRQLRLGLQLRLLVEPSPGAASRRRWPRRSTRGWSSSGCSATAEPSDAAAAAQRERYQQEHPRLRRARTPAACKAGSAPTDQRKLDEYLTGVREIEQRHRAGRRRPPPSRRRTSAGPTGIPQRLRRAHPADVRPAGAGVPGRHDARSPRSCFANEGSNRSYRVHRRARGPPRPVAPRQRRGEAGEDPQDQPLPRRAVRLPARRS